LEFEYDDNKSLSNLDKHGIDFEEAQRLWEDENALIIPAKIVDSEIRYAMIARGKCFLTVFTMREHLYRLISVRRCRKNEEKHYETNFS
jgi:uncharacterized DUF497 family protein